MAAGTREPLENRALCVRLCQPLSWTARPHAIDIHVPPARPETAARRSSASRARTTWADTTFALTRALMRELLKAAKAEHFSKSGKLLFRQRPGFFIQVGLLQAHEPRAVDAVLAG